MATLQIIKAEIDFINSTKKLLAELIVPVTTPQSYGTPGKVIGWRCLVCNHDGSKVDFSHDSQCLLATVRDTIPNVQEDHELPIRF